MKFKKGDLIHYKRDRRRNGACGILTSVVLNNYPSRGSKAYKCIVVHDDNAFAEFGCIFYLGREQEEHWRVDNKKNK